MLSSSSSSSVFVFVPSSSLVVITIYIITISAILSSSSSSLSGIFNNTNDGTSTTMFMATLIPTAHGFVINNNNNKNNVNNAMLLKKNGMYHPKANSCHRYLYQQQHRQQRGLLLHDDDDEDDCNNSNNNKRMTKSKTVNTNTHDGGKISMMSSLPALSSLSLLASPLSIVSPELVWSMIGTSLGYIKAEYGFSYAYGFGTAVSSFSILKRFSSSAGGGIASPLMKYHALALVFYGVRLNVFLFLRTLISDRQKQMIQRIEARTVQREQDTNKHKFVARTPVLLSCGLLYYCLSLPVLLTSKFMLSVATSVAAVSASTSSHPFLLLLPGSTVIAAMKTLIGLTWCGFSLAALGDFTKSYVKFRQRDEQYLVTSGVFKYIRHPNYVGEMVGWSANALCGLVAGTFLLFNHGQGGNLGSGSGGGMMFSSMTSMLMTMLGSCVGWIGIMFVLVNATTTLEKNQRERYGGGGDEDDDGGTTTADENNNKKEKYRHWIQSSWKGLTFPTATTATNTIKNDGDENEIELNDVEEDSGSGI